MTAVLENNVSAPCIAEGITDLTAFTSPEICLAHSQWLTILTNLLDNLQTRRIISRDECNYAGTLGDSIDLAPLEQNVEAARKMVSLLGGEIRRRSEGEFQVWLGGVEGHGHGHVGYHAPKVVEVNRSFHT